MKKTGHKDTIKTPRCEYGLCEKKAVYSCDIERHYICSKHGYEQEECPICEPSYLELL